MKDRDSATLAMKAEPIRWLCTLIALTLGIAILAPIPLVAQGNCQTVNAAMDKVITTPTHIYNVTTDVPKDGSKPRPEDVRNSETVYAGGSTYLKAGGRWIRGRWTAQQVMQKEEENRQNSKYSCRYLRDEQVNGETAVVYSTHSERQDEDIRSDAQVWISKRRGLPLRHEYDMNVDMSDKEHGDKEHHSVRYEYTNVQPPI